MKKMEIKTAVYSMPTFLASIAKLFPGLRSTICKIQAIQNADYCEYDGVHFRFDNQFMNRKRFVAIACGAIENEEVKIASKVIREDDVVVEFGAGLGIAASRVNKICAPKKHICFEANPLLENYAKQLFRENNLSIQFETLGLGNGNKLEFFAMKDYILSSFEMPEAGSDFEKILVPTLTLDEILSAHKPTVIFCDIEGAELSYFRSKMFEGVDKIIIELHPRVYGSEGLAAFQSYMEGYNFALKFKKGDTYCFMR